MHNGVDDNDNDDKDDDEQSKRFLEQTNSLLLLITRCLFKYSSSLIVGFISVNVDNVHKVHHISNNDKTTLMIGAGEVSAARLLPRPSVGLDKILSQSPLL